MNIHIEKDAGNDTMLVSVEGSIDTVTAPELSEALLESCASLKELIIDFTNVDYISSAGLRVMLLLDKKISGNGQLTLRNLNDEVRDVFEMTGFDALLNIE